MSNNNTFYRPDNAAPTAENRPIAPTDQGKIYADVPLNFFDDIESLKDYVVSLKKMGVNVLLILPHFLPSFSAYVVRDYETPCQLFSTWEKFADFMLFVKEQGLDRMIDIPFNHADWQARNLKREWFKNHNNNGTEAGADDVDADNKRVRINWGAFILDNSIAELQDYWLEKVIFPHIEKYNVNAIRIDAAWGLDPDGLKRLVGETRKKHAHVWFLAENLGMSKLIKLAESGIAAGCDRFFNNIYWYSGGRYIPSDIYALYKRSKAMPTCSIYSSHDTLMPAMKSYARLRSNDVEGLNDKAIVRKFVEYEDMKSLEKLKPEEVATVVHLMKLDFVLAALMSSDVMLAAGSELGLFERIDVLKSGSAEFARGVPSDLPDFMGDIVAIKHSAPAFNREGVVIPFGRWQPDSSGVRGFVKSDSNGAQNLVAVNTDLQNSDSIKLAKRIRACETLYFITPEGRFAVKTEDLGDQIEIGAGQTVIITSEGE